MPKRKENIKNKMLVIFSILFGLGILAYFMFRDTHIWVTDIIPEFLGAILIGFFIFYGLKRNIDFKEFLITIFIVILIGTVGYVYGLQTDNRFLTDLSPELLGSTGLSLVLSLIFKKKIWH